MADNGTEMHNARQQELDYETRAAQIRQRIVHLITSYADIEAEADDLRPTVNDDLERLDELENRIRNNIADLPPLSVEYDQLVAEYDQLDQAYGIMTTSTPWTRSMFTVRKKCLNAASNRPSLPTKVVQLSITFNGMIAAITAFRQAHGTANASHHSSPNPGYIVQSPASSRRTRLAITANSAEATASQRGSANQLAFYNPLRAFELAWRYLPSFGFGSSSPAPTSPSYSPSPSVTATPTPASSPRSASPNTPGSSSYVAPPRPTPMPRTTRRAPNGVPIVTRLDFGDDTPVSQPEHRQPTFARSSDGVMSFADPHNGNIRNTRSMAWNHTYQPMQGDNPPKRARFFTDGTTTAPVTPPRSLFMPREGDKPPASRPYSGPAATGPTPHSGEIPTRLRDYDLPPYVPPTRAPAAPEVDRLADDLTSLAAGRGSETSARITTPLTDHTEAASNSATPSSDMSTTSKESTSAFYRNATFARRTCPDGTLPANLVLKELPLKPFDGDVRCYPEFRDNFLTLIESQAHLGPQQKLQHLMNHLRGAPLQMAEGFGFTDDSYFEVIELLEATYGDKTVIQNLLLQDLISIEIPSGKYEDLSTFHADARKLFQRLKKNGQDMTKNVVVQQMLLGKLPAAVKEKVVEKIDPAQGVSPFLILDELLAHINMMKRKRTCGLAVASAVPRNTSSSRPRSNSRPRSPAAPNGNGGSYNQRYNYHNGTYVADTESTFAASKQPRYRCNFCGDNHWSAKCTVYPTVALRIRRLEFLKHCFFCLGGGHWSRACPHRSRELCKVCKKAHHHVALCRTYMGESRPGTPQQAPAKSPKPAGGFGSRTDGVPTAQPSISAGESIAPPAGGMARSPAGGSSTSRSTPDNTVTGKKEAVGASHANNVRPPSAQNSRGAGHGNSKNNRKQQRRNNNKGTNSSRQSGTPCHAAATSDENTTQKGGEACSDAGLLPGHQALLQTGRCSNPSENAQFDREAGRDFEELSSEAVARQLLLRDDEELSLPDCAGYSSDPDLIDFDDAADQHGYPTDDGYAVSASSQPDTQAVLLECIKVTAVNPVTGASREAIAFFDSGSSATFASTDLARDLDLPCHEATTMLVNTFGAKKPSFIEGFSTSIVLRSAGGQQVHLNLVASDHGVKSVRTALINRDDLPPLQRNAGALVSTRERPDILIGQDAAQLFKRRPGQDLPNGFYVVHTVLGPLVGGAGRVTTEEPKDVHAVATPEDNGELCQPPQMVVIDIMDRSTRRPARPRTSVLPQGINTMAKTANSADRPTQTTSQTAYSAEEMPRISPEGTVSAYLSGAIERTDAELLGDFSYLENAGMGTYEMKPDDQTAADMLQALHTREPDGRFNVPLLFRTANGEPPSNNELPTNIALAKGRAISTRNTLAKDPKKLADYHEIVLNYRALNFIGIAPRTTPFTKHCLSHHPVFKETSTTTATRPVFDASAKLPGRTCLNDWVYRGPILLPTVPAILLRSRFPSIIVVSDIGKAFLQMSVKESHRDCLRWFWFKDPFKEPTEDNLVEYRFNRVPFGLKSSPYLLAGVIKMHLESEGTPLALEMLKNCYVDNVLLMADTVDEALQKYRDSKAIFAKIQMTLREYASNNSEFNNAIDQADRADLEKLRELGIRWDVTADYWDIPLRPKPPCITAHSAEHDGPSVTMVAQEEPTVVGRTGPTPSKKPKRKRGKKADDTRLTKRTMLRFVAQIFDPMGLVQALLLLAKLVIQEVWKIETDWDEEVPDNLAKLWYEAIKDFDQTTIRIPRKIAIGRINTVEIHVFTDGSSQAYGFTAYLRVKDTDRRYRSSLVFARARVKPIKDADKYTIPRMELLGVLTGARAIKFLHQEISVMVTATYLWSDSTIVLHQIADDEKIKDVWVENRLLEIRQVRDAHNVQFRHVPTADNPADIVSRGLPANELQNCAKWWFGPEFLSKEAALWPNGPSSLTERTNTVQEPISDLSKYGSSTFAALYEESFTPEERIPKRKLRSRKKPNPLDSITKPLPVTTVSAHAIAALGQTAHSVASLPPLPSTSLLPEATEQKYPQWPRQVRITYYVLRFAAAYLRRLRERIHQKRLDQHKKVHFKPNFTPSLGFDLADRFNSSRPNLKDLSITEMIMLRKTQLRHPPSSTDRRNLGIFEHQGLLYVRGRLGNMKLRPTALTPLYLPKEAKETELLIMNYHRINCHSGVQNTLANIRMRYWFTSGRRTVRKAIYKHCFPCRREALHPYASPPWPQLPTTRVTQARPFFCTGLDFFGPCQIRAPHPDGGYELKKCYVAIFVCMTYRCVHLELCSDLSTEQFLHALRRFGSRREYPARILSDNGASFLTARQVIHQLQPNHASTQAVKRRNPVRKVVSARLSAKRQTAHSAELSNAKNSPPPTQPTLTPEEEQLIDFCQTRNIEWQTITELSPWRGGVYERLIGLIKHCLRRSIGRAKPTDVEFSSLLAEAERTANSRPLSYIADSDTDFYLVRPLDIIHPLLREEAPQHPLDPPIDQDCDPNDQDFVAPGENRLHVKMIQGLKKSRRAADTFWIEFRDGYLADLRSRGVDRKNNQFGEPTIQIGDLVLIKEPDVPRCDWRLALVVDLLPDQDGLIRTARVRFSRTHQEHTRALEHLYPIGNVPRVPSRVETTICADVYSISFLSEGSSVSMAATTTSATTTGSDMSNQDLTTTEANTTIPPTSTTANSAEEVAQAQEQPPQPLTTTGTSNNAADHTPDLDAHSKSLYDTVNASLAAIGNICDEQARRAILEQMAKQAAALLAAGPRADPVDQEKETSSSPQPSDPTHVANSTTNDKSETAHSAELTSTVEPIYSVAELGIKPATVDLPSAQSSRSGPSARPRIFRGSFGKDPVGYNRLLAAQKKIPSPDVHPPTATDSFINSCFPSQASPPNPASGTTLGAAAAQRARGATAPRGRGRGRVPKHSSTTQRPTDLSPEFPDSDPPTFIEQPEQTVKPKEMPSAPEVSAAAEELSTSANAASPPETAHSAEPPKPKSDDGFRNAGFPSQGTPTAPAATTNSAETTESHVASVAPSLPPAEDPDLVPATAQMLLDPTTLPSYPSLGEIERRLCQLFTGRRLEDHMLATRPLAEPQSVGFGFNATVHLAANGRRTNHSWDPITICDGHGEDKRRFHQSLLVSRFIIKTDWQKVAVIARNPELQDLLAHVLTLHVRCFGHMILLVFVIRLRGNHPRAADILSFVREMLKSTDFEEKIPQLLNQYYPKMTVALARGTDPLPTTEDFCQAALYWLCYCRKAFVSFMTCLSGWPTWCTEWMQSKELDARLRKAFRENIYNQAVWVLQDIRERAYQQYILRRVHALETNDQSYKWARLAEVPRVGEEDSLNVTRIRGKVALFVDDDVFHMPISKFLKDDVQLIKIESDNRNVLLGSIRRNMPGPETRHAIFWFGRQYINNGNEDYGNVIAEICRYYSTIFGQVRQYIILPPYNRIHRGIWTGQVLCLYLQKDIVVPHAQVVLHPYDVRFWTKDQTILNRGEELPEWSSSVQNEDGLLDKAGALEARKYNMREFHRIDLWTWYQKDHPGENPPAEIKDFYERKAAPQTSFVPATPHSGDGPTPSTTASAAPAVQTQPPAATAPTLPPVTSSSSGTNPPANIVNIFGERMLAEAIQLVTQQATVQLTAALDAKLSRIEALLSQRQDGQQPDTTAEDRPQDSEDEEF